MPLNNEQVKILKDSIDNYYFPTSYYDFLNQKVVDAEDMSEVEKVISTALRSDSIQEIRHGLANVVFWGNATAGYRMIRMEKSFNGTTDEQLKLFQNLVANTKTPTLLEIKQLGMPQFSFISFISKIVMFLEPEKFCVLDNLIARLAGIPGTKALHALKSGTGIPVSQNNFKVYYQWSNECIEISQKYFDSKYRSVDVERGLFSLIRRDELVQAQQIYRDA